MKAQGRYKKRENSKLVKNYSASDIAAILGVAPPVAAASLGSKDRDESKKKAKDRIMTVKKVAVNWWGRAMFTQSSQLLGDQELKAKDSAKDSAFTERDQEDLYTNAQKIGTQNRQGLGLSTYDDVRKSDWSGKKKTFDGDD